MALKSRHPVSHTSSSTGLPPAGEGPQAPSAGSGSQTHCPIRSREHCSLSLPPASDQSPPQLPAPSPLQRLPPRSRSIAPGHTSRHPLRLVAQLRSGAPSPPAARRGGPAETPAASLTSATATYPHTLSATPGTRWLPWPPPLTTARSKPPQSAQGSAGISQRCPQMGLPAPSWPERPNSQQPARDWCGIVQRKPQIHEGLRTLKIPGATEAPPGTHQLGTCPAVPRGRLSSRPGVSRHRDPQMSSSGAAEPHGAIPGGGEVPEVALYAALLQPRRIWGRR